MKYYLYSGAGNTFAVIDNRTSHFKEELVHPLCHHCKVDGVLLLEPSHTSDYSMRIFNRDGSPANMCGNGLRSMVRFLEDDLKIKKDKHKIETASGIHFGWFKEEDVCIQMPPPKNIKWNLTLTLEEGIYTAHHLNTGVPHLVLFVDSVERIDVALLGKKFRHHPQFDPLGTNVNFVSLNPLTVRTYERGVEEETLACGTGAVASVLAVAKLYGLFSPLEIQLRSKDKLKIAFTSDWSRITVQGPAKKIGEGNFSYI